MQDIETAAGNPVPGHVQHSLLAAPDRLPAHKEISAVSHVRPTRRCFDLGSEDAATTNGLDGKCRTHPAVLQLGWVHGTSRHSSFQDPRVARPQHMYVDTALALPDANCSICFVTALSSTNKEEKEVGVERASASCCSELEIDSIRRQIIIRAVFRTRYTPRR